MTRRIPDLSAARMAQHFEQMNAARRPWLERHGTTILVICGAVLLGGAIIIIADKALANIVNEIQEAAR